MPNDKPKMYGKPKMDHGPKMYDKPKSAGLKALAAKNKNLTYTGPAMSGGGPKKVGSQERYNDSPFNYKAQVMMADMPMMYGAGKPKSTDPKDGVTVTGNDKRKSAEEARKERLAKRKEELERIKEKREIAKANRIEELKFKLEERKAKAAAKRQRMQLKRDRLTGRVDSNAEDTSTNY